MPIHVGTDGNLTISQVVAEILQKLGANEKVGSAEAMAAFDYAHVEKMKYLNKGESLPEITYVQEGNKFSLIAFPVNKAAYTYLREQIPNYGKVMESHHTQIPWIDGLAKSNTRDFKTGKLYTRYMVIVGLPRRCEPKAKELFAFMANKKDSRTAVQHLLTLTTIDR